MRRRLVTLVIVSFAAGGCASARPPAWWPFPHPTEVTRRDPHRDPSEPAKRVPAPAPEPDRLEPLYRAVKP